MRATISAIIPTYNASAFVAGALAAVQAQTRLPTEVLVVDDCSTDGTADLARALGARVIELDRNRGPSAARNAGIAAARGEYVAFLDADDKWDAEHCDIVAGLLDQTPGAGLAFSRVRIRGGEHKDTDVVLPPGVATDVRWRLLAGNIVPQITVIARRSLLIEVGGYDETRRLSEDFDLWLRLSQHTPFVFSDAVTATYSVHDTQVTRNMAALWSAAWDVRAAGRERLRLTSSADDMQRATAVLHDSWRGEVRWAWNECDPSLFQAMLAAGERLAVPASEVAAWRLRARRYWSAWVALKRIARRAKRLSRSGRDPSVAASH